MKLKPPIDLQTNKTEFSTGPRETNAATRTRAPHATHRRHVSARMSSRVSALDESAQNSMGEVVAVANGIGIPLTGMYIGRPNKGPCESDVMAGTFATVRRIGCTQRSTMTG